MFVHSTCHCLTCYSLLICSHLPPVSSIVSVFSPLHLARAWYHSENTCTVSTFPASPEQSEASGHTGQELDEEEPPPPLLVTVPTLPPSLRCQSPALGVHRLAFPSQLSCEIFSCPPPPCPCQPPCLEPLLRLPGKLRFIF